MTGPLAYIGGKNRIAKQIIATFPKHTTYVEPFAGGAQVFFHKEPSKVEVLNDLDGDVVNFFRICQRHHDDLVRYLKFVLVSRRWFALLQAENAAALTDMERAARFFYLQKNAFAGLIRNRKYHCAVVESPNFKPGKIPELIKNAHRRLDRAQIESLPYGEILARYDRPGTLFYLDPPYWGRKLYNFNFADEDFVDLAERLKSLQGKFVLSINDVPRIREIFQGFVLREIEISYTSQTKAGKRFRELLIANFKLPAKPGKKAA
ncbi:MAG: DNA adenine methylase [Acidobacteriaceae bacterium]|nr:DNA adenine methylase [Acidobacteriaceae bacterium]